MFECHCKSEVSGFHLLDYVQEGSKGLKAARRGMGDLG